MTRNKLAFDFTISLTDKEAAKNPAVQEWLARVKGVLVDTLEAHPFDPFLHEEPKQNKCKCCRGEGQVDVYDNARIRCPLCGWPLAKCHGDECNTDEDYDSGTNNDCNLSVRKTWGGV